MIIPTIIFSVCIDVSMLLPVVDMYEVPVVNRIKFTWLNHSDHFDALVFISCVSFVIGMATFIICGNTFGWTM